MALGIPLLLGVLPLGSKAPNLSCWAEASTPELSTVLYCSVMDEYS